MTTYRDILMRLKAGGKIKGISRELGIHRNTVRHYRKIGNDQGWFKPGSDLPDDATIHVALNRQWKTKEKEHHLDRFTDDFKRYLEAGDTYLAMYNNLKHRCSCSEATIRRYVQKRFPKAPKTVVARSHLPGKVMEVDFAYVGQIFDEKTNLLRKAWLFSARLRYSREAYREIVFTQHQSMFFACHVRAFEAFGGVPETVVPDNLKAAVIRASFEDPLVNRSYFALALHYGFRIDPCLPATPRHKGGVESDMRYVQTSFLPRVREKEFRRGHPRPRFEAMVEELAAWNVDTSRMRVIGGIGKRPLDLFADEKTTLAPLPALPWEPVNYQKAKVGTDWHVRFDRGIYSVPHAHIGAEVLVAATSGFIRIFLEEKEIATHSRVTQQGERSTKDIHGPEGHQRYLGCTREGVVKSAFLLGETIGLAARAIVDRPGVDGLRPARRLVALVSKYPLERVQRACRRVLEHETVTYGSVKAILEQGLDKDKTEIPAKKETVAYRFHRAAGYFLKAMGIVFGGVA